MKLASLRSYVASLTYRNTHHVSSRSESYPLQYCNSNTASTV